MAATLVEKTRAIADALSIPGASGTDVDIVSSIARANELMGLHPAPGCPLPTMADALLAAIGCTVVMETRSHEPDSPRSLNGLGQIKKLEVLNLAGCESLESLPREFCQLINLKILDLTGCASLAVPPSHRFQHGAPAREIINWLSDIPERKLTHAHDAPALQIES